MKDFIVLVVFGVLSFLLGFWMAKLGIISPNHIPLAVLIGEINAMFLLTLEDIDP